jgi:galactonate dehydratase
MKITAIETLPAAEFSNLVWVKIETDEGITGLGKTFRNSEATAANIYETCAPYLIDQNPLNIERHFNALANKVGNHHFGYPTCCIEWRDNSAVDIALWDILGKSLGQPVRQLMGSLSRDSTRVYNTCASSDHNNQSRSNANSTFLQHEEVKQREFTQFEDLEAQMAAPGELAQSLQDEGIPGMKIWPFDGLSHISDGHDLSFPHLKSGVRVVEDIRKAVGNKIGIVMEYHALWRLPQILKIARALDEFDVYWHEDPLPMYRFDDLEQFKHGTTGWVCGSENLGTKVWYAEAFQRGIIDVVHFDLCWIGGLTEGRKVAALAETYERPIVPHDCVSPVTYAANSHLVLSAPNALKQQSVRAFYKSYYRDVVIDIPEIKDSFMYQMMKPGLGLELLPDFANRSDIKVQRSDGSVDARGRFYAGTMPMNGPDQAVGPQGTLYCLDTDRNVRTVMDGFYTVNGQAFSPDGKVDMDVKMPVEYPTRITFGSKELDTLYVTSIGDGEITTGTIEDQPQAGGLFAVHVSGITGCEFPKYQG